MSQAAKVQEPSMEEILASIRRIIADDEAAKPPAKAPEPVPMPKPVAAAPAPKPIPEVPAAVEEEAMSQDDIDAMLAGFEGAPAGKTEPDPEPEAEPERDETDVLDLTEAMEAEGPATDYKPVDMEDVVFTEPHTREPHGVEVPPYQAIADAYAEAAAAPQSALLSEEATAAVTSAFGSLAHTVLVQNARTLDDLVREMLRPMLKSWLDDNLPTIVERLVRAEIERVSRGRG